MRTVVGDPNVAAIEVDIEEPRDDRWLLGQFRLHVLGEAIGDWDDIVTLRAVVAWWQAFAVEQVDRWDIRLEGLGAQEVFTKLRDAVYSKDADEGLVDVFARYHVNRLGMSAFDPFVVVLVEPPDRRQWLLWQRENGPDDVHEAWLPARTLQTLGAEFVAAIERDGRAGASP